jgi:predicted membrane-bound spermidine synthase
MAVAAGLTHPLIVDGWFAEAEKLWPGQRFSLRVKEVVHVEETAFQDLLIFDSETYGRVLVLDGAIQVCTRDEVRCRVMAWAAPRSLAAACARCTARCASLWLRRLLTLCGRRDGCVVVAWLAVCSSRTKR